jgi:hypothetical protein
MMEEMKKIDQELGIDEDFKFSENEEEPIENIIQQVTDIQLDFEEEETEQKEEENPIQQELARINRRENLEMGRKIEELKRQVDDRDLKVEMIRYTPWSWN